jgi:hypothetical protein
VDDFKYLASDSFERRIPAKHVPRGLGSIADLKVENCRLPADVFASCREMTLKHARGHGIAMGRGSGGELLGLLARAARPAAGPPPTEDSLSVAAINKRFETRAQPRASQSAGSCSSPGGKHEGRVGDDSGDLGPRGSSPNGWNATLQSLP